MSEAMAMLSQSSSYMTELRKSHSDRGAFRSGMGTMDEVYRREMLFTERERMEELEDSKEIVTDMGLVERQFKYFNERL
jgi:hypothetical protein